jgi:hypothetical protein
VPPILEGLRAIQKSFFRLAQAALPAVGIELKATLKARKLLISLNAENAKNTEFA